MTELEKVLAELLDEEWGREGSDVALIARPSKLAQFLAPHIERARDAAFHVLESHMQPVLLKAMQERFTESLREALNDG